MALKKLADYPHCYSCKRQCPASVKATDPMCKICDSGNAWAKWRPRWKLWAMVKTNTTIFKDFPHAQAFTLYYDVDNGRVGVPVKVVK